MRASHHVSSHLIWVYDYFDLIFVQIVNGVMFDFMVHLDSLYAYN